MVFALMPRYLAGCPHFDSTLSDSERETVIAACKENDTDRVLSFLDGVYAAQLHVSFNI